MAAPTAQSDVVTISLLARATSYLCSIIIGLALLCAVLRSGVLGQAIQYNYYWELHFFLLYINGILPALPPLRKTYSELPPFGPAKVS